MTFPQEPTQWTIEIANAQRTDALAAFGFTDRQARFLLQVLLHAGVFVERQYCHFAGIVHGQKSTNFINALIERRFASPIATGKRHRGRMFHVHYKPLWTAIGEPDSRFRKPAALGRMIERVMLLDAVLDDGEYTWLGPATDKRRHFIRYLGEQLPLAEYPRSLFGDAPPKAVRYFPDKLPIGVQPFAHPHVLVYVVTRPSPMDFRLFLLRHTGLLRVLCRWTIRLLIPRPLARARLAHLHAAREHLAMPLQPSNLEMLTWLFTERKRLADPAAGAPDPRYRQTASAFRAPASRPSIATGWTTRTTRCGWPVLPASPTRSHATTGEWSASSCQGNTCISPLWLSSRNRSTTQRTVTADTCPPDGQARPDGTAAGDDLGAHLENGGRPRSSLQARHWA